MFDNPEVYQAILDCYAEPDRWAIDGDLFLRQLSGLCTPLDKTHILSELTFHGRFKIYFATKIPQRNVNTIVLRSVYIHHVEPY